VEINIQANREKTTYMLMPCYQNAGKNHNIKIADKSFANVAEFKYLGTIVTNQNLIQEGIKRKLNSCDACYHSVQKVLYRDVKIKI
jgi:hypothetical protein